jgi:ketosteroid isomerase-like protein
MLKILMRRTILGAAVFASATLLGVAPPRRLDDRAVIEQTRRRQNDAIARGDFAAAANAWTEDISVRAGLGRNLQGRTNYLAAFIADSAMTYVREPTEIIVSEHWPLAYERGRWVGQRRSGGTEALLSGQYSAQWVRAGSNWQIRSEVFVAIDCAGEACQWPAASP